MDVCRNCHYGLHQISIDALQKIIDIKRQFGHLWKNCHEQYLKSNRYREVKRLYKQTPKNKEWNRNYVRKKRVALKSVRLAEGKTSLNVG